ncbi:glycosyltransferase family 2 protein [Streptococcus sp. 20-1249]|uniref:glycosyltransferase family 2 protein n=1 Tax=Streptococcus hepaticus TaxID=3349163 RepID=UPI00374934CC
MDKSIENSSISVIIPAYNAEKTIERAVKSIYLQSRRDLIKEVLVIDDGSNDQTQKIVLNLIKKWPEFSLRIISKENGGVASARNIGLQKANGKWIAFLDADDEWTQEKLAIQEDILNRYPEIDCLGANHTEQPIRILGHTIDKLYRPNIKEVCLKSFPQTSTILLKKRIFEEIGGFDEARQYAEDGQFFNKVCLRYGYYYTPEQLCIYDGGKRGFGDKGLSGNLKAMKNGVDANMKELLIRKEISLPFYCFIRIFNDMKYIRRLMITKCKI